MYQISIDVSCPYVMKDIQSIEIEKALPSCIARLRQSNTSESSLDRPHKANYQ